MSSDLAECLSQLKTLSKPEEGLITILPQEITIEILRRVPLRSVMRCKHVCKSWRDLIEGDEFMESYTMKPGLVFSNRNVGYVVCDEAHEPLFRFDMPAPHNKSSCSTTDSTNGLLLVRDRYYEIPFIINPVTREYIKLHHAPRYATKHRCRFGFGVSKLNGRYKILCCYESTPYFVYTLGQGGGGSWRSIFAVPWRPHLSNYHNDNAVFLNGNLHWLTTDFEENHLVCCFDLETELITSYSLPTDYDGKYKKVCVLGGRLCLCHVVKRERAVIWSMKNYEDENSWSMEYTFILPFPLHVFRVNVLANGDLVFAMPFDGVLFIYSKNTDVVTVNWPLQPSPYYYDDCLSFVIYTPSLNLLKVRAKLI